MGYADAERVLAREGYEEIAFPDHRGFGLLSKLRRVAYLFRILAGLKRPADVVFIYPMYAGLVKRLVSQLLRKQDLRLICYLADIDGIKDGDQVKLEEDVEVLKGFRHFIVHNEPMKEWVQRIAPEAQIATLEFFDFLSAPSSSKPVITDNVPYQVAFAGNLHKSKFLLQLAQLDKARHLHFHLYGPGGEQLTMENAAWHGSFDPYQLPSILEGQYGLVWDGDSINGPAGSLGEYMRLISHHKTSLYILAGLPLIVPSFSATALLVKKYGIGITVDNLHQLAERIPAVTESDYLLMKKNMEPLAMRISKGRCIAEALALLQ